MSDKQQEYQINSPPLEQEELVIDPKQINGEVLKNEETVIE
jgi:hypothetical protein